MAGAVQPALLLGRRQKVGGGRSKQGCGGINPCSALGWKLSRVRL